MIENEIRLQIVNGYLAVMELRAVIDGQAYGKSAEFIGDFQNLLDALMDVAEHNGNTKDEMIRILASLMRKKIYKWM